MNNSAVVLATRLREYVNNVHHINPLSEGFVQLIHEAADTLIELTRDPIYKVDIPTGVYYNLERDNFYDTQTRIGCGAEFYGYWIDRKADFPQTGDT